MFDDTSRFGLFVHWGIYAVSGWHEQVQQRLKIPRERYAILAEQFEPVRFDPDQWLDLAQEVGMTYIVVTAKHHDGFCLWDTAHTDFKSTRTPCARDLVGELASACHRRHFSFGIYYSVVDWNHPNYPNEGRHHELEHQPGDQPDMPRYVDYVKAQLEELLSNYGDVDYLFWDMNVPQYADPSVHELVRRLQPHIRMNDRGFHDYGDPDAVRRENLVVTPEREYAARRDEAASPAYRYPTEACNALDSLSWGYRMDPAFYSTRHIESQIAEHLGKGGRYLLNVGPDRLGEIPVEQATRLRKLGRWYRMAEDALCASPASHLVEAPGAIVTRRGETLYVLLHQPPRSDSFRLKPLAQRPVRATLLNDGRRVDTVVDRIPSDVLSPCLRFRSLPVDEMAGEVMVVQLDFDEPLELREVSGSEETI